LGVKGKGESRDGEEGGKGGGKKRRRKGYVPAEETPQVD